MADSLQRWNFKINSRRSSLESRPFDLFIRWKPLYEQPLGWNPDINDGVRLNIRPFMKAERRKGDKKGGVGILRWKPNIKWAKDRGKEPISLRPKANFPWFWNSSGDGTMDKRTDFTGGSSLRREPLERPPLHERA